MPLIEFLSFTLLSIVVVIFAAGISLKSREPNPVRNIKAIALLVFLEAFCMILAKYSANWAFPWWIYYPVPMLLTLFFPVIYFKMSKRESLKYILLIFLASPLIHVVFSLFGWNNYMPFIEIQSLI
jgi:hypothetical protein